MDTKEKMYPSYNNICKVRYIYIYIFKKLCLILDTGTLQDT